jgi:hypothetical protein
MRSRKGPRQMLTLLLAIGLCAASSFAAPAVAANGAPRHPHTPPPPPYGGEQDLALIPEAVDVWTQPSIFPGELLNLHVSSPTPNYSMTIKRETYSGSAAPSVVFSEERTDGVDQRGLVTWDATTATARAVWPTTSSIDSTGWLPGVYTIITGNGIESQAGRGIFVVKSPTILKTRPLFALSILTYQAYNNWGGASFYKPLRSVRLSLERPYRNASNTVHGWLAESSWLVWMSKNVVGLQYTTDYDLSLAAPRVNPSALILGQHTEYVSKVFRDWLDRASGDRGGMEIANFGTNTFYWQVRLEGGIESGSPKEIVAYKGIGQDPLGRTRPKEATYTFRSKGINRPEGALLGAQYGACCLALTPTSMTINPRIPPRFLTGTGLRGGSKLVGLYRLEADFVYPAARPTLLGSATRVVKGWSRQTLATVIRTGARGARIFNAGSLVWVTGFEGTRPFGVSRASFIRFNANILDWLQIKRN